MKSFRVLALAGYGLACAAVVVALAAGDGGVAVIGVALGLLALGLATVLLAIASVSSGTGEIARAARSISAGDFSARTGSDSGGEVGEAAGAFDAMASRLEVQVASTAQERSRLMAAINSSIDAVIAVDANSNITFANQAVEGLLGREPGEVIGQPLAWVIADPGVISAARLSDEQGERSGLIVERPNRQFLQAIVTPIVGGGDWTSLVVLQDVTDAKRVEEVRQDFIANVSHELRTPLAGIKSVLETLEGGALNDRDVARDFISRADMEVDRLVQIVEELLELSRIESGELERSSGAADVGAVVVAAADRMRPQAERAGLRLSVEVAPGLPGVVGDRIALERALVNLVHNAIKFTPRGGAIDVGATVSGGGVVVSVRDTGAGIEPEDLPRVFERFYKADRARAEGGTGLGLAIVRRTAEAHGGRVEVDSQPGEGSTFRVWLPPAGGDSAATQPG